jgi:hypothetical protein
MNHTQKNILVAVIVTILLMLAFPPFQIAARNGIVYNKGYHWIFSPPFNGRATVNVLMLIAQWIGVLLIGGLAFYLSKNSKKKTSKYVSDAVNELSNSVQARLNEWSRAKFKPTQKPLTGVGGWLLLLVLGMTLFGPLLGASQIYGGIVQVERQYPALLDMTAWASIKRVSWIAFFFVAALSIYGGWGLYKERDPSVVKRAKVILWVAGPGAILFFGIAIPSIALGDKAIDTEVMRELTTAVISAAIWTAYLSKSKRVRNTYYVNRFWP